MTSSHAAVVTLPRSLRAARRPALSSLAGLAIATAMLASAGHARAASSEWVESEGGKVRLIAEAPGPDGTIRAALDIALKPGWKTYWLNPGEAGIPPTVGLDGSVNVQSAQLRFPPPVTVDDGYSVWAGYKHPVALPLVVRQRAAGEPTELVANVFLGICEKICIPFQANFKLALDRAAKGSGPETGAIEAAYALLPEAPGADFAVTNAALAADRKSLEVDVRLPAFRPTGEPPHLYVAGPEGWQFGMARLVDDGGATARFSVPLDEAPQGTAGGTAPAVALLVTSGPRSMETTAPLR